MDWQRLTKFGMVMRLRLRQPVTFCDFLKSKMLMPSSWKSKNYNISKTVWPNPRWQTVTILKMKNRRLHFLISWICRVKMYLIGNKMADINIKDCSLSTVLTATDQKLQKLWKGDITQHHSWHLNSKLLVSELLLQCVTTVKFSVAGGKNYSRNLLDSSTLSLYYLLFISLNTLLTNRDCS